MLSCCHIVNTSCDHIVKIIHKLLKKGEISMISAYLRINKNEEKSLLNISEEINRQRLDLRLGVMKESEILHKLINEAFKKAKVVNGEIIIE